MYIAYGKPWLADVRCDLAFSNMRKEFNLELKKERRQFLDNLYDLIGDWTGQYPNLGSIFRPEEVDWLLSDSIDIKYLGPNKSQGGQFIEFVTRSGYKDKPNFNENGKPLLQRTTALIYAAKSIISNNSELVSCLFKIYDRYDANYIDERGLTHFHIACRHDFDDIVKKFLEHGLDPNIPITDEVNTPLNLTIIHERKKCFELLLKNGANPNYADDEGLTPLHLLCDKDIGHDWMELFFKINEDLQQTVHINAQNKRGLTPLHRALCKGEIEKVKLLLQRGANPNMTDKDELTPLHIICNRKNDDDLAKIFLQLNDNILPSVKIDARDKKGDTPLHSALSRGLEKVSESLLRNGANPNLVTEGGLNALHIICKMKHKVDLMKMFFDVCDNRHYPVQVDARDKLGRAPLLLALQYSKREVFELLLRKGADPNLADKDGSTPLHIMCQQFHLAGMIKVFFEINDEKHQTVQIDNRDNLGRTPLHLALEYSEQEVCELLLDRGADPSLADKDGWTPLHFFCMNSSYNNLTKIFKISDEKHQLINVDVQNKRGDTPLHLALKHEHKKVVELLLRNVAYPNLANEDGSTYLHLICNRNNDDDLVDIFFNAIHVKCHLLHIDTGDKLGRTPLQLAVANLLPHVVDVLLDHGADLSKFIFPHESYFGEKFDSKNDSLHFKLELASGVLAIVERLKIREYELNQNEILTIMTFFTKHKCISNSGHGEFWHSNESVLSKAKKVLMNPSMSLHELIRSKHK